MSRPIGRNPRAALARLIRKSPSADIKTLIKHAADGKVRTVADIVFRTTCFTNAKRPERIGYIATCYESQETPAEIWRMVAYHGHHPGDMTGTYDLYRNELRCSRRYPPWSAEDRRDAILAQARKIEISEAISRNDPSREMRYIRKAFGDFDPNAWAATRAEWPNGDWMFRYYYVSGIRFLNSPVFGDKERGRPRGRSKRVSLLDDMVVEKIGVAIENDASLTPYGAARQFWTEAEQTATEEGIVKRLVRKYRALHEASI